MVIIAHRNDTSPTWHIYLSVCAYGVCLVCMEQPERAGDGCWWVQDSSGCRHLSRTSVWRPSMALRFPFHFGIFLTFSHHHSPTGSLQEPPPHQHQQQQTSKQATQAGNDIYDKYADKREFSGGLITLEDRDETPWRNNQAGEGKKGFHLWRMLISVQLVSFWYNLILNFHAPRKISRKQSIQQTNSTTRGCKVKAQVTTTSFFRPSLCSRFSVSPSPPAVSASQMVIRSYI